MLRHSVQHSKRNATYISGQNLMKAFIQVFLFPLKTSYCKSVCP